MSSADGAYHHINRYNRAIYYY